MVQAAQVASNNVPNRKVCVIDTGCDIGHPDPQDTSIGGYTGSFRVNAGPWDQDGHGYGTHVAGTIATIGNNGMGVVGVVPTGDMQLYIVKVFNNSGGWAWTSSIFAVVEACVGAGSNVASMSLGRGGKHIRSVVACVVGVFYSIRTYQRNICHLYR